MENRLTTREIGIIINALLFYSKSELMDYDENKGLVEKIWVILDKLDFLNIKMNSNMKRGKNEI